MDHVGGPRRRGGCGRVHLRRGRRSRDQSGRGAAGLVAGHDRRGALRAALPRRVHRRGPARAHASAPTTGGRGPPTGAPSSTRSPTTSTGPTRCGATRSGPIRWPMCSCCRRTTGASSCRCERPGAGSGCSSTPRAGRALRRGRSRQRTRPRHRPPSGVDARGTSTSWSRCPTDLQPFLAVTNHGGAREFTLSWVGLGATDPATWRSAIGSALPGDPEVADSECGPARPSAVLRRFQALDAFSGRRCGHAARVRATGPVRGPRRRIAAWTGRTPVDCAQPRGHPSSWGRTSSSMRRP